MDLISREDAIRWVKTECNPYGKPTLDFESGKKVIEHLEQMPSAEPEQKKGNEKCSNKLPCGWCSLFDTPCFGRGVNRMNDLISRQAAIDAIMGEPTDAHYPSWYAERLEQLPSAQPEQRWIPFKTRPLTEEEREEHPEWDCILDCKLPDNGQRILVAIRIRGHEEIQQDEFYSDDGSYLDSGYEIGTEAVAWMPLPKPYNAETK